MEPLFWWGSTDHRPGSPRSGMSAVALCRVAPIPRNNPALALVTCLFSEKQGCPSCDVSGLVKHHWCVYFKNCVFFLYRRAWPCWESRCFTGAFSAQLPGGLSSVLSSAGFTFSGSFVQMPPGSLRLCVTTSVWTRSLLRSGVCKQAWLYLMLTHRVSWLLPTLVGGPDQTPSGRQFRE